MNELHLFAGAGGGILGGMLLGHTTICAVEINIYCREVLLQRQRDGILPRFPIWDDVRTFDGKPWKGIAGVVCGGFPCQDISCAGKGAGIRGARSGLWSEMARIVGEIRPQFVFVENSPLLTSRGLDVVLGNLAAMGYDAEWGVFGACDAGAPHKRERIWILANADRVLCDRRTDMPEREAEERTVVVERCESVPDTPGARLDGPESARHTRPDGLPAKFGPWRRESDWWATEPELGRVANGVAHRVDRLRSIGNGQVPEVARLAWRTLTAQRLAACGSAGACYALGE